MCYWWPQIIKLYFTCISNIFAPSLSQWFSHVFLLYHIDLLSLIFCHYLSHFHLPLFCFLSLPPKSSYSSLTLHVFFLYITFFLFPSFFSSLPFLSSLFQPLHPGYLRRLPCRLMYPVSPSTLGASFFLHFYFYYPLSRCVWSWLSTVSAHWGPGSHLTCL